MVYVLLVTFLNLTFCQGSYLVVAHNSEHILRREALESIAERLRKGFSGSPPYEHLMKNLITCPSGGVPLEANLDNMSVHTKSGDGYKARKTKA